MQTALNSSGLAASWLWMRIIFSDFLAISHSLLFLPSSLCIYLFNQYILSAYYMPGTVLGRGNKAANRTDLIPVLTGLDFFLCNSIPDLKILPAIVHNKCLFYDNYFRLFKNDQDWNCGIKKKQTLIPHLTSPIFLSISLRYIFVANNK